MTRDPDDPRPGRHYFHRHSDEDPDLKRIELSWQGRSLPWFTAPGVFASGRLDPGSALLLECLPDRGGAWLDVGCGTGVLGILAQRARADRAITMIDVNFAACAAARANATALQATGLVVHGEDYAPFRERAFDVILTNPPIRAGRPVVARILGQAPRYLREGGELVMVGRVQQGVKTLGRIMAEAFGHDVEELERHKGYRVLRVRAGSAD